jgi:FtsP/CotA-like multicopper oxidase with cupredoxin domain
MNGERDIATAKGKGGHMTGRLRTMRWKLVLGLGVILAIGLPSAAIPAMASHSFSDQGIVCTNGSLAGTTRTFSLEATAGHITMPDGNAVFMWGYNETAAGHGFQAPGPTLCAQQGETVVVKLRNNLPDPPGAAGIDNVSIVFPGQEGVSATGGVAGVFTNEAPGFTSAPDEVTYSFTASEPGTYLYESGTNPVKQLEMGMSGALVIRPDGGGFADDHAYNDARTRFNSAREYVLLLSEIDTALHAAVESGQAFDPTNRKPRYFLINGRAYPDVIADNNVPWLPTQPYGGLVTVQPTTGAELPALVRYLNAGLDNHPFHPHGNHVQRVAQDGRLLLASGGGDASMESFTRTVGSGQTYDSLFVWEDEEHYAPAPTSKKIPVTIPTYRNLLFPEDVTLFSGSPYLGYKGTLPIGVTSQNICGEYYFPWHSHDLIEIVNFDEAFGGMLTLLRVNPPASLGYPQGRQINSPKTPCS